MDPVLPLVTAFPLLSIEKGRSSCQELSHQTQSLPPALFELCKNRIASFADTLFQGAPLEKKKALRLSLQSAFPKCSSYLHYPGNGANPLLTPKGLQVLIRRLQIKWSVPCYATDQPYRLVRHIESIIKQATGREEQLYLISERLTGESPGLKATALHLKALSAHQFRLIWMGPPSDWPNLTPQLFELASKIFSKKGSLELHYLEQRRGKVQESLLFALHDLSTFGQNRSFKLKKEVRVSRILKAPVAFYLPNLTLKEWELLKEHNRAHRQSLKEISKLADPEKKLLQQMKIKSIRPLQVRDLQERFRQQDKALGHALEAYKEEKEALIQLERSIVKYCQGSFNTYLERKEERLEGLLWQHILAKA
ncbi:MAG: hypothetical protein K0S07_1213 [Chlamydiales bacterium]|jgi:hypothetical protein|nr:hypothetical protein [Chlamydiales bacterium]